MAKKPVYIRSDILKVGLSSEGIFSYAALSIMQNKANLIYATPQSIWCMMCGTDTPLTRDLKDKLISGLMELHEYRIVNINVLNGNLYEIDTSRLDFDKDSVFYECIYPEEIRKICSYKGKVNKFDFVKYFIIMVSSFDYKIVLKVGEHEKKRTASCLPLNLYQKLSGLSRATVVKYNTTLEEIKVLFFTSSPKAHTMNYYCRYEDKEALLDYLKTNNLLNKD